MPRATVLPAGLRGMGRPHLVVLSLLSLLGMLAMHSTPAIATPSNNHPVTVVTSGAASQMNGMNDGATPQRHVTDMTETLESWMPSATGEGHGDQTPAQHHMLQPCMSDTARAHLVALNHVGAASALAAAQAEQPRPHSGNLTVLASRRDISPPDLTKLCISRT